MTAVAAYLTGVGRLGKRAVRAFFADVYDLPGVARVGEQTRSAGEPDAGTAYFACDGPHDNTLRQLALVNGARWTIEVLFELGTRHCGLDKYEVRSGTGGHQHVSSACQWWR